MIYTMRTAEVLKLRSPDYRKTIGENVHRIECVGSFYDAIREQMKRDGINAVPIFIDKHVQTINHSQSRGVIIEGCHRIALAVELGHETIRVTDTRHETGAGYGSPVVSLANYRGETK
jgi:hypothetical protein